MTGKEHLNSQLGLNLCNTAVLSVCVMCPKHIEAKLAFNHTSLLPYFNLTFLQLKGLHQKALFLRNELSSFWHRKSNPEHMYANQIVYNFDQYPQPQEMNLKLS